MFYCQYLSKKIENEVKLNDHNKVKNHLRELTIGVPGRDSPYM